MNKINTIFNHLNKIKQAFKTIFEMLTDRGYEIVYNFFDTKDDESFNENTNFPSYMIKAIKSTSTNEEKLLVTYCNDEKLNINFVKDTIYLINKENVSKVIIVYRNTITPYARNSFETTDNDIELFSLKELQINITKHDLVCKHELVTSFAEKEYFNDKYKGNLPILLLNDPISKYYGFNRGDLVRIYRKNNMIVYRSVK